MNVKQKAANNSFYLFLYWIINTLGGFVFWMIAGKFLNESEYGIALTAISFGFLIISIITLGIPAALSKLIPEYKANRQMKKINSIITTSLAIILIINILNAMIFFSLKNYFVFLLKITDQLFYFIIAYIFFGSFSVTLFTIKYSFQLMKEYTIIGALSVFSKILLSFVLLYFGFKYFGPILGVIFSSIITIILAFPGKQIKFNLMFNEKDIFSYSILGFFGALFFSLIANFNYSIITIIKSTNATGIFGVAMMISSVISAIPNILNNAIYPIISELFGKRSKILQSLINHTIRYSLLITLPLILIFSLNSRFLILTFSSDKFVSASKLIPILSVSTLILGIGGIFVNALFALRMTKYYTRVISISTITFLIISFILVYLLSETGAAISYFITSTTLLFLSYIYLNRKIKVEFAVNDYLKIIISSLPFLFLLVIKPMNLIMFILANGLLVLAYATILYKLKFFTRNDINIVKTVLAKLKISKLIKADFV